MLLVLYFDYRCDISGTFLTHDMASYAVDGFSRGSVEKIELLLKEAKKYKEEGNTSYQESQFRSAIRCYHKALFYIRSINQGKLAAVDEALYVAISMVSSRLLAASAHRCSDGLTYR